MVRTKVDTNKLICTDFGRKVLGVYRKDRDELSLVDLDTHIPS